MGTKATRTRLKKALAKNPIIDQRNNDDHDLISSVKLPHIQGLLPQTCAKYLKADFPDLVTICTRHEEGMATCYPANLKDGLFTFFATISKKVIIDQETRYVED